MRDNRYTNQHLLELLQNDISLKSSRDRILTVDTLIIDEISMISAKVFDQLEFVCRCLRQNNKLFGGIQIIVSGDFGQLPPVANENYADPGHLCFTSQAWQLGLPQCHVVILDQVMRQHEPEIIAAIRELALGELSNETKTLLFSLSRPLPDSTERAIYLYARNFEVEMTNYDHLRQLDGQESSYHAKQDGMSKYLRSCQAPEVLVLKPGCRVMLVANVTPEFVNGSLGYVIEVRETSCVVDFDEIGRLDVNPYLFTTFSRREGRDIASRLQLPLRLAYATTIHKAQGMSLSRVVVDARKNNKPGQLATAVGRCTSKDGLQLLHFSSDDVPKQLESVKNFLVSCNYGDQRDCDDLNHTCCNKNTFPHLDLNIPSDDDIMATASADDDQNSYDDDDITNGLMEAYDHVLQEEMSLTENSPDFVQLRNEVQQDFSAGDTPDQVHMRDCDREHSDTIDQYLISQWHSITQLFKETDTGKSRKHKDFSDFLVKCDKNFMSREHDSILRCVFKNQELNPIERRLAHKYQLQLQQRFLSRLAQKGATNNSPTTDHAISKNVEPSDLSKAGIRYLAGMCFAKAKYRQSSIALHNIHKLKEIQKVQQARLRVGLLDTHIHSQKHTFNKTLNNHRH
jgi:ATP-dependent DNA helicase PIF1